MPIRVLFAIGSMEVGGAERQLVRYLQHLNRQTFSPGLYLIAKRGALLSEVPSDVPIFTFGERVRPPRVYIPGGMHRSQVHDLAAALDAFGADQVVTRSFHLTLIAASAARRKSVPLVAIDASNPRWDFRRNAGRFQFVKKRLVAKAYSEASAVVALSEGAADGLAEFYGVPRHRIAILSSSIDLDEIRALASEAAPPFDEGLFHVVAVGRLAPEKGHRDLIEAIALVTRRGLPNVRLHLIGDGPLRKDLEGFATTSGVGNIVRFMGFQSNPIVFVRQADVFCLPSHYEGMPGALLEAMACGVPAVATDCDSGPRELLAGGRFGTLVPVRDPVALAEAIANTAANMEAASEKAAAAQIHVTQRYTAQAVVGQLENLLFSAFAKTR